MINPGALACPTRHRNQLGSLQADGAVARPVQNLRVIIRSRISPPGITHEEQVEGKNLLASIDSVRHFPSRRFLPPVVENHGHGRMVANADGPQPNAV